MKRSLCTALAFLLILLLAGCTAGEKTEDIRFTSYASQMDSDTFSGSLAASNDILSNAYVVASHKLEVPTTVTLDYRIAADGGDLYVIYVTPLNNERRLAVLEGCAPGSSAQGQVIISMPKGENTLGVVGKAAAHCQVEITLSSTLTAE